MPVEPLQQIDRYVTCCSIPNIQLYLRLAKALIFFTERSLQIRENSALYLFITYHFLHSGSLMPEFTLSLIL